MTGFDELAAHMAQYRAAIALRLVAVAVAAAATWRYGLPGFCAGTFGVWFVSLAKPAATPELDKRTGRKPD